MACAQAGDREPYRAVPRGHRPLLLGWLRRRLADSTGFADMYQEALVHVQRARHTYGRARPFVPWVLTTARHCAVDQARRRASGRGRPRGQTARRGGRVDLDRQALRSLPRPQREAFSMLKLEAGPSVGAAAARAGVTPSALKVHAHRAYIALKVLSGGPIGGEADPCAT